MVTFTCNHCEESLKKSRVEEHCDTQCKSAKSLTCTDCLKDFHGEDYLTHTTCATEKKTTGGSPQSSKDSAQKKNEVKQATWMEMIKAIINNSETTAGLEPALRNLLIILSHYPNVPKTKTKFMSFLENCCRSFNAQGFETVWNYLENHELNPNASTKSPVIKAKVSKNGGKRKLNGENAAAIEQQAPNADEAVSKKKKRKSKAAAEDDLEKSVAEGDVKLLDSTNGTAAEEDKFSFQDKIMDVLKDKGSVKVKKLQKKVIGAYLEATGETDCTEKTLKKFNKTLKKLDNVKISDDVIQLVAVAEG